MLVLSRAVGIALPSGSQWRLLLGCLVLLNLACLVPSRARVVSNILISLWLGDDSAKSRGRATSLTGRHKHWASFGCAASVAAVRGDFLFYQDAAIFHTRSAASSGRR
jgi:hypothetical protein